MLSLFRSNQAFTALPLFIYVVMLHAGALLGFVKPELNDAPASLTYTLLFGRIQNAPFWSAVLAVAFVYIQAVSINLLADRFRLLVDRSWLPGMAYALVSAALPDFLFLSPPLVAATFVPFALWRVLQCYKANAASLYIFDAAFWTGISAVFYPPALFLLLASFAGIMVMRSFKLRENGVFFSGIFTAMFLAWLYWFWMDKGLTFRREQLFHIFNIYHFSPNLSTHTVLKWGFLALLFLSVMLSTGSGAGARKSIQIQKSINAMMWFWLVGSLCVFLQRDPSRAHFLLSMSSIGIYLSMFLAGLKNKMMAELAHLFLLATVFFIQYFPQA